MRRVVILSAFLSPLRSGAEACAEEVPLALADQFDFTIVTAKMRRDLPRRDSLQGKIPVLRVGLGFSIDKWLFPFLAPFVAGRLQPDILHGVLETFAGLALFLSRWVVPGAKRMLTLQTTNRSFLKGPIIRCPHRVTAISSALLETAQRLGRSDVVLIPNGLNLKAVPHAEKVSGRILFVGRLEPMKGIDVLLKAFKNVVETPRRGVSTDVRLHIVGDGSERAALEERAKALNIADRVTFLGRLPIDAVYREFAEAEIFCGLSRSEALGNVFLEAQAAGCAVIGTNIGGIPDIVRHEETGLLVPPDEPLQAAAAMDRLLTDRSLRERLSAAGKEHAQAFDWSAIAQRYADIYENM